MKIFIYTVMFMVCGFADAGSRLLVVNKDSDSLSVLNPDNGETLKVIKTGRGPHEVSVTPNQQTAVVTNYGFGCSDEQAGKSLTVVDLSSYQTQTVDLSPYKSPHGIVSLADNQHVLVTVECSDAVLLVDVINAQVVNAIDTHANVSHMVSMSNSEHLAFTANIGSGSVSVIDLLQNKHLKNIKTGTGAEGIDVTPDGRFLWVSNRDANNVSVIDIEKLEVVKTFSMGQTPIRVKFHPNKPLALISNAASGTVALINTSNYKTVAEIPMAKQKLEQNSNRFGNGPVPIGILFSPSGDRAFIANTNVNQIKVLDIASKEIMTYFTAENRPDGLAWVK